MTALPTFTTPPAAPPRRQDSRAQLTAQIGQLLGQVEELTLTNAELRLAVARERVRNDAFADLLAVVSPAGVTR